MKKSAAESSPGSDVKTRVEWAKSCGSTSRVRSWPALSSRMRAVSISKPITGVPCRPNATATGSPTYPRPMTASLRPCGTTYLRRRPEANRGFLTPHTALFAMDDSIGLPEQTPVKRDHVAADALTRELQFDQFAAGLAELAPQLRVEREAVDGIGEGLGIVERHQKCVDAGTGDLAASRHVGRNQRAAAGGSLQEAQGQPLAVGRQHRDMRARPEGADVFHEAKHLDVGALGPGFDLLRWDRGRVGRIR